MKTLAYSLRYFLIIVVTFVISGILILLSVDKIDIHLYINQYYSETADFFFKNITNIGDGAFALVLLPYLILFKLFRFFIISLLAFIFSGLFVQFLKRVIFSDHLRPTALIESNKLHIVEGINLHTNYSFPSGHTASAFVFFMLLAFYMNKNKLAQILFAFCAILVGFSRIYLSQHFLIDVSVGAILGTASFFIAYYIVYKMNYTWLDKKTIDLFR